MASKIKSCGCCKQEKELNEFYKNKTAYDGHQTRCKSCEKESRRKHPEKKLEQDRRWRSANKEKCRESRARWADANPGKNKEAKKKWELNNPDNIAGKCAKRHAAKLQRTMEWADTWKIKQYYIMARKLTRDTGIKFVVDHIVPLQGKLVSGLHIESNLQVITEIENLTKFNKFISGRY